MGNRADVTGSDVEVYRDAVSGTIRADTPTGAHETLLAVLDSLGLERRTVTTAGPEYVWHEVPEGLSEDEQKRLASRAIPTLLMAGYAANITTAAFDPDAYLEAANEVRAQHAVPDAPAVAPHAGTARPRHGR
ncbi:hypothetical protein [Streptomyces sp. AK02-01A]|uniref:hypothetical protein n=1 Tax=Streptomyces sp. AK02-01A TaxID=3028648 RepID=UPI0029AA3B73|nr:hypothetical protein [Streptomyces sp. AK02-01A]MDX3855657.1 hypothetical protein [Streptomyces sp. AK02-01A]